MNLGYRRVQFKCGNKLYSKAKSELSIKLEFDVGVAIDCDYGWISWNLSWNSYGFLWLVYVVV